jgi:hypothetical protein
MALEPIRLDDLDWKGMVESIRRRIPAASDGHWTLHAPVDPGVTLLELFASLLEQRLYWMDQVPDALTRGALRLLGVRPRGTSCATTVMQLLAPGLVARRTELTLAGGLAPIVYSTRASLAVLPVTATAVRVDGVDRSLDLASGRVFRLAPPLAGESHVAMELKLAAPPAPVGEWCGLLLQLRTPASIASQWSANAVHGVPPPGAIAWSYRAAGQLRSFMPGDVDDGTAGLRRSGIVRVRIPADWQPEGAPGSGRDDVYAIHARLNGASFTCPPRLIALVPNAVIARNTRATRMHAPVSPLDWLPLPGNVIALGELPANDPVKDVPPLERGFLLEMKERDGWHRWRPVADLFRHGPADRVFIVDREKSLVRFGDGLTGRLPVLAAPGTDPSSVRLRYLVGGGTAGAIGRSPTGQHDWQGPQASAISARAEVASEGGADIESMAAARVRAAAGVRRRTRAVIAADYVEIATTTPGVAIRRAHAAIGRDPRQPCVSVPAAVTVYVVPEAPREDLDEAQVESAFVAAPLPDAGALAAVTARLEAARLVGTELFVRAPRYRAVALAIRLQGASANALELRQRIELHLRHFLDPLVGGDARDGWPFGEPLRPSVILREAQEAAGTSTRVMEAAIGLDGAEPGESCRDVAIGDCDLVWLERLELRLEPGTAGRGGLR